MSPSYSNFSNKHNTTPNHCSALNNIHKMHKNVTLLPILCPTGEANGLPPKKDMFWRQMTIMWCNTPSNPNTLPTRTSPFPPGERRTNNGGNSWRHIPITLPSIVYVQDTGFTQWYHYSVITDRERDSYIATIKCICRGPCVGTLQGVVCLCF
jgi:hypothetical protein